MFSQYSPLLSQVLTDEHNSIRESEFPPTNNWSVGRGDLRIPTYNVRIDTPLSTIFLKLLYYFARFSNLADAECSSNFKIYHHTISQLTYYGVLYNRLRSTYRNTRHLRLFHQQHSVHPNELHVTVLHSILQVAVLT